MGRLTSQQTEKDDPVCGVIHKKSKSPWYTAGKNKAFARQMVEMVENPWQPCHSLSNWLLQISSFPKNNAEGKKEDNHTDFGKKPGVALQMFRIKLGTDTVRMTYCACHNLKTVQTSHNKMQSDRYLRQRIQRWQCCWSIRRTRGKKERKANYLY